MKIDYKDGRLYPRETYDQEYASDGLRSPIHSDFPLLDSETKERLLTRHEELAENLDLHFAFYDSQVQNKVEDFKAKYDPSSIINVDGHGSPSERFEVCFRLYLKVFKIVATANQNDFSSANFALAQESLIFSGSKLKTSEYPGGTVYHV